MSRSPIEMHRLEVRLFGPISVHIQGVPVVPPRTRKGFWILALLALRHGRDVDRRWLAGTLWPDSSESQALYNLRRSLSDLRNTLNGEAKCITATTAQTLRLSVAPESVDVVQFDAAIARGDATALNLAISLYSGPLLEGCSEEWAIPEARTRERAYLSALEILALQALEQGNYGRAEELARRAVTIGPENESVWRLLLRALAGRGDLAALTVAYRDLRLDRMHKFNAQPDPLTTTLFDTLRAQIHQQANAEKPVPMPVRYSQEMPHPARIIPRPLTPLIGRETHTYDVVQALVSARLLTLTGSGGVGKTRLALGVAELVSQEYVDGVWFVDLATITDSRLVPHQVALVLGVREKTGFSIQDAVCEDLLSCHALMILDNCEHLLDACGRLVEKLLSMSEHLRIVVTSRIPLQITGEVTWRVPSLNVPPNSPMLHSIDAAEAMTSPAVQLFVARIQQQRADFRLNANNVDAVVEICRRLDGIPLAIELAAARGRHMAVAEIARRLDNAVALLTGGSRTALPRRQTLRASIDWSWSLLNETEQAMLARLSVFAGDFSLNAAEVVCATDWTLRMKADNRVPEPGFIHLPVSSLNPDIGAEDILDLLGILVDSSLVIYSDTGEGDRFRLPETIRQYAAEKLEKRGDATFIRQRHAAYYLTMAESALPHMQGGPSMTMWLDTLERENADLRRALEWYEHTAEPEIAQQGLHFAGTLQMFWLTRGCFSEGRRVLSSLLDRTSSLPPVLARASALNALGRLTAYQGEREEANALHHLALQIYRNHGNLQGVGETLNELGNIARQQEQYSLAEVHFQNALHLLQQLEPTYLTALVLYNLGTIHYRTGFPVDAAACHEQALREFERQGNRHYRVLPLLGLAHIACKAGRTEEAHGFMIETLKGCQESGDVYYTVFALEIAGLIICEKGEARCASLLLGAAAEMREYLGSRPTQAQQHELEALRKRLKEALGAEGFALAFSEGRQLSRRQALDLAVSIDFRPEGLVEIATKF